SGSALEAAPPAPREPAVSSERRPSLRERYFHDQRAAPNTELPPGALRRAREEQPERGRAGAPPGAPRTAPVPPPPPGAPPPAAGVPPRAVAEGAWTLIGPQPIQTSSVSSYAVGQLPNSGRVTAVVAVDADVVYLGAAAGGVWKTVNGGATWTPLTDDQ